MQATLPLTRDLVLVGGGHTHALVLRKWGMTPLPGTRVTLINPGPTAPYTGMLPGHVAGHYRKAELEIDLVRLARFAGARLVLEPATGIDRAARQVSFADRPPISFDVLSVDIGITSELRDLPGFKAHGVASKPLGAFAEAWRGFVTEVAEGRAAPKVAVLGAGVGGVELALAMRHRLLSVLEAPRMNDLRVTLIEAKSPLADLKPAARTALLHEAESAGIALLSSAGAAEVTAMGVVLDDGRAIDAGFVVSAAGARPHGWLAETGLTLEQGFISVLPTLQTLDEEDIFAVGDCAHMTKTPRPKAGVYAVRQAPGLYHNLRARLSGGGVRAFRPQGDFLKLISLGGKTALGEKFGVRLKGRWLWRLKDRIDRSFMDQFHRLTPMAPGRLPANLSLGVAELVESGQPLCAGCGAKIGPDVLRDAIAGLDGIGDDAAILETGGATQVVTTDHLRAFSEDPWLFARIAAEHALGDIYAMGAEPQAALANITLPYLSEALQARTLRETMAGLDSVLRPAGAPLAGGHTTTGAEFSIGLTLTGLCAAKPITLSGARPSDVLILTKPIGSGTILSAEMSMKAEGVGVAACLAAMDRSQGEAARILAGAHAMTDVTGFGIAGHLLAICQASGVAARLDAGAVPTLSGARDLAALGQRSTLYPRNLAAYRNKIRGSIDGAPLIFDPQTSGGLLAAMPARQAKARLKDLKSAGYGAAIIGTTEKGKPEITLI